MRQTAVKDATELQSLQLPAQPAECGRAIRSGVKAGDRLDTAAIKTDIALGSANARGKRCAEWYDALRKSYQTILDARESEKRK